MGISAAAGTVNQTCVFIGSDLDGPIGWESFPNGLCWDPTGVTQEIRLPCPRFGRWGGEVGSGEVAAPLALARRGRVGTVTK